ncbi:MAG: hypothetical protein H6558_21665 [Lewinellaceae bacterium]|nr:hypothetical protein [Lewinellaceae bacterium]
MKKNTFLTIVFGLLFSINLVQAQQHNGQSAQSYQNPVYHQGQQPANYAQPAPQGQPYQQVAYNAPVPAVVTIRTGTPVELETLYPLNGKHLSQGQTVDLRVKYDVIVDGYKMISAGAPAKAIVSSAERNKMFGKGGEIQLLPQYVQMVDGQFLPVSGMAANFEGKGRKGWAIGGLAAGLATGGVGFLALPFIKGKAAEVPAGMTLTCSVMGDRTLRIFP